MDQDTLELDIDKFDFAMAEAAAVCTQTADLIEIVQEAPEKQLNNATMQVLNHAIEGLQARTGVQYNTLALESATTSTDLKNITLEGLKEFAQKVWRAIKDAIQALYQKIVNFLTDVKQKMKNLKNDLKRTKDQTKTMKTVIDNQIEINSPNPYILHASLFKNSDKVKVIDIQDLVKNIHDFINKSNEKNIIEDIGTFHSNIGKVIANIQNIQSESDVLEEVYSIINNYVSDSKLDKTQVQNRRRVSSIVTKKEFDSQYGNKRYHISFSLNKKEYGDGTGALNTDRLVNKTFKTTVVDKLIVKNINQQSIANLYSELDKGIDYLSTQIDVSRYLRDSISAIQDVINNIEKNNAQTGVIPKNNIESLAILSKVMNAVVRIFKVFESEMSNVLSRHFELYKHILKETTEPKPTV